MTKEQNRVIWALIISSSLILAITMGARQSLGLFVEPLHNNSSFDIVTISLALAIGQLTWGFVQPFFGAIAYKKGSLGVLIFGSILMFIGLLLTPFIKGEFTLIIFFGVLISAGAGAGAFSILIGTVSKSIPNHKRSFAAGFINAGGSFGQFVYAPITQAFINIFGWVWALIALAFSTLITIPLARKLTKKEKTVEKIEDENSTKLKEQIFIAIKDKSYIFLNLGFFTCGFHVAFLTTHLPGEVVLCGHSANVSAFSLALIGFFNIFGSLYAGYLGTKFKMKYILFGIYFSRALMIIVYILSPKTELTFYIFAIFIGLTWLATVPPTAGIVGKLFGTKYLGTLFGLTLLSHQIGAFLGAYLGGLAVSFSGNFIWMWYLDIVLALLAAFINLPIKEESIK
ncbi:MFS transporter [Aliarcobacter trophiarum LMG 25534]|uniref:MFS transporter n=1 Tax=Aliarcobacter trophiarum LMG 25534 TaxID=1032241 RepID=A0AAD0QJ93_9BACT|nr:MFS transporter [Aliarcobacter trophiarum]AXK48110.1 major facilitator superfamily transporter [Aliarcobacter trophiarum LMG 25534]RXJ93213.1 MFS transporter [Aliarcobacter trophiarum LMG 25534]